MLGQSDDGRFQVTALPARKSEVKSMEQNDLSFSLISSTGSQRSGSCNPFTHLDVIPQPLGPSPTATAFKDGYCTNTPKLRTVHAGVARGKRLVGICFWMRAGACCRIKTTLVVEVGPQVANVILDQVRQSHRTCQCQHEAPPQAYASSSRQDAISKADESSR